MTAAAKREGAGSEPLLAARRLPLARLNMRPVRVDERRVGAFVVALVCVRAEVVALGLGQVLGELGGAVGVEVGQRGGHGGSGNAGRLGARYGAAPGGFRLGHRGAEGVVEEE